MEWISFSLLYVLLFFIFHSSSSSSSTTAGPQCHPDEHSALLQLKSSFSELDISQAQGFQVFSDGTLRASMTSYWKKNTNCCKWDGITCDNVTGHVIGLDLSCGRLKGPIHSNSSLFFLHHLQTLCLSYNDFNGSTILPEFGQFKNMTHLYLSFANFSGDLPLEISHLSKLVSFRLTRETRQDRLSIGVATFKALAQNLTNLKKLSLSGINMSFVPHVSLMNLSSSLTSLELSYCQLHGKFPQNIFQLHKLESLSLQGNLLTGEIPKFNRTSLKDLGLGSNQLHGTITRSIFQQVHLKDLDLSSNNFTIDVELEELSKLKELEALDLSSNNVSWSSNSSINYTIDKVSFLGLSSCNMIEFPSFLKSFKSLESLDLSSNQINGSVPEWLWELGKDSFTSLNLSNNCLTYMEPLPWNKLETLDLHSNFFVGPLPISSSPNLSHLFLSKNQFAGEIPTFFCDMMSLSTLDVSNNNLSGTIPPCFGNLSSTIRVLDLRRNRFQGSVPPAFGKGCRLRILNMDGNQLEGSLPRSLSNCEDLEILDIGNNKINGSFPQWLESLPELQVLILKSNRFYGPISNHKIKFSFHKLRIVDISNNQFSGVLPTKYFESLVAMMDAHTEHLEYMRNRMGDTSDYSVTVTIKGSDRELVKIQKLFITIDFSRNNFTGAIPMVIGKLNSLKGLNFSHNKLYGSIPSSLGNLSNLESLDLSSNELSGNIPLQLAEDLNQLGFLNLSNNKLEGPIPRGKQFDTFSNDSYRGNVGLCGFPLSKSCSNDEAQVQDEGDDGGEHNTGMVAWKMVMMGYASGLVIGISIGYMVFFSRSFDYWFQKRFGGVQCLKTNDRLRRWRRSNWQAEENKVLWEV